MINLNGSKLEEKKKPAGALPWLPVPGTTVAQCASLCASSSFDLVAAVTDISDPRDITLNDGSSRRVVDLVVEDGSTHENQQAALSVTVWLDAGADFKYSKGARLAFYGLNGKKGDSGYNVSTAKNCVIQEAPQGVLPDKIEEYAGEKFQMQTEYVDKDYSSEAAFEVCVCILDQLQNTPSTDRLYQVNWCHVSAPGDKVLTDKKHLYFKVALQDATGQVSVWMRQAPALSLSELATKDDFAQKAAERGVTFPLLASCRFLIRDGSLICVDASPQDLTIPPSQSSEQMFPLIACASGSSGLLPASLENLQEDQLYNMKVDLQGLVVPCQRALVLLCSTRKSTLQQAGNGFLVLTENVTDAFATDQQGGPLWKTRACCTLESSLQYRLDPPKPGAVQYFLAIIGSINSQDKVLTLTDIHLLGDDTVVTSVRAAFGRYKQFCEAAISTPKSKRPLMWTPTRVKRCKTLSSPSEVGKTDP